MKTPTPSRSGALMFAAAGVLTPMAMLQECTPPPPGPVVATELVSGLDAPWQVAFTPDGTAYVTERVSGGLYRINGSSLELVQTFTVDDDGEGGLLGLAVSPTYASDQFMYAFRTTSEDNEIIRFRLGEEPEVVVDGIPDGVIHNAGRIAFGPDGKLYVGTGDAGVDQPGQTSGALAQDPNSLAGKILRYEPDGSVPADNPTAGSPVYALGFRDPQGLAWDANGTLYVSEFGPDRNDEINVIQPGGNYGWPQFTGPTDDPALVDPIFVQQPPDASWSGIEVPKQSLVPQWDGDVLVAALRGQRLWRVDVDDPTQSEALYQGEYGRLRDIEQAPDGSLWLLTSNSDRRGDGTPDRIIRLAVES
jgi:glucose/arabinose dehydrogenase